MTAEDPFLFAPSYWGQIPDFANQFSTGGLSAVVTNLSGYVSAASYALTSLVDGPTTAIWNTPFALITAAGYLINGQIDEALAELQSQIIAPLNQTVTDVLQAVGYVLDNSIANAGTLLSNTIPGLLSNMIGTVVGGTSYVVQSLVATLGTVVSDLAALKFEDAWNGAVNGLLGVNGTLGQIESLIVGVGIIEPVDYDEGTVDTVVIPSVRSNLTSAGQRLGDLRSYGDGGIRNDAFVPEVAASTAAVAPQAAAVRAASTDAASAISSAAETAQAVAGEQAADSAADVSTPAAATTTSDSAAPAAEKPAAPSKHKATRKAARVGAAG